MSYLIRQGFVDRFVPVDRSRILAGFEFVSIEKQRVDWARRTPGLGSLMTVPQVLLAGDLAVQLRFHPGKPLEANPDTPSGKKALHLIAAYIEEYGGDQMSLTKRDEIAHKLYLDMHGHVVETMRIFWSSVAALADALAAEKTLSEARAFQIIEAVIPEERRARARTFVQRDPRAAMREMLDKRRKKTE